MVNIIYSLLSREIYSKYKDSLYNIIKKDNKELYLLYKYITELHDKYSRDITFEEFSLYTLSRVPEKDREVFSDLLHKIQQDGPSDIVQDIFVEMHNKHVAYNLALKALEASEGRFSFEELRGYTQEHLNAATPLVGPSMEPVTHDLDALLNGTIKTQGLRWRLTAMNQMLGSLRKGNFGFIFARPETGKTTFLASEISHFAQQTKRPILWFNNEEDGAAVELRVYQATLGCTLTELRAFPEESNAKFIELGGTNIKLFDSASIHRRQVEELCAIYDPALIVFDQLDKVKGFVGDREDLRLGGIYVWARELAKQYCPVIAVSQADVSGEGKKWLNMENVANAKTAKQAEADWILGIGCTFQDSEQYDRFLHLSKNKLIGDTDTIPELRHGKMTVRIVPELARYED
jgi:KaiC/GvpD/RAD55 family RecA-like ATPase